MYAVGTLLAGKYRVEQVLGEGGMGIVLAAHHVHLDIDVALKLLHNDATDADRVERFVREARACAQLRSENVCRVMDVGILDDGVPYMVMEMLVGSDLQTRLSTEGPLPASTACDCIMQACLGIAEAHAAGIVHRDLKPGNLFWTQRPDGSRLIKVLDFGIAKASNASYQLTQSTHMVGSPGYMSPEQLRSSKDVDARTDVWALGVVLYQLVTGKLPFIANSITELAMRIETQPMPAIAGLGPLEQVIAKCLEKHPAQRCANVGELAGALAAFVGPRGADQADAVKRVLRGGSAAVVHTAQLPSAPTTLRGATGVVETSVVKRPWKVPVMLGLAVVAVAATVIIATTDPTGERSTPSAAPAAQPAQPEAPDEQAAPAQVPVVPAPVAAPAAELAVPVDAGTPAEPASDAAAAEVATTTDPEPKAATKRAGKTTGKTTRKRDRSTKHTTIEEVSESRR